MVLVVVVVMDGSSGGNAGDDSGCGVDGVNSEERHVDVNER